MRTQILLAMMALGASTTTLGAQPPGPAPGRPGPMPAPGATGPGLGMMDGPVANPAEFLLAHTGEFRLTDAQVTRLAAIARRAADRRQALRAQLDSLRPPSGPGFGRDSAARERMQQRMDQMRPVMERFREQSQADRRDAIAVLTPDQQAQAWERIATAGRPGRGMRAGFAGPGGRQGMRGAGVRRDRMTPGRPGPGRGVGPRPMRTPNDSGAPRPRGFRRPE